MCSMESLKKQLHCEIEQRRFIDAAIEEYLTDNNMEMFLLTMHYLIEIKKNPIDKL